MSCTRILVPATQALPPQTPGFFSMWFIETISIVTLRYVVFVAQVTVLLQTAKPRCVLLCCFQRPSSLPLVTRVVGLGRQEDSPFRAGKPAETVQSSRPDLAHAFLRDSQLRA